MTGPEHYREGERLLAEAKAEHPHAIEAEDIPAYALLIAEANAHFAAAQAAATALTGPQVHYDERLTEIQSWREVAGVKPS